MNPIVGGAQSALIVIDVQNDFMPGGALAVPRGDEIVSVVNEIAKCFENVIITQDWHPKGHASFASSHKGKNPFELADFSYGKQVLWPDHCVQGTRGAELHSGLDIPHAQLILRKGCRMGVDSYSAFYEADRTPTGLVWYLKGREITHLYLCGLATDFCVAWSAIDASSVTRGNFATFVLADACRAIDLNGSLEKAWSEMFDEGVEECDTQLVATVARGGD